MTAVLALGSNLGDRLAALLSAVEILRPFKVSSVWETTPVGGVEQGDFLNAVVLADLPAAQAWALAQSAERAAGRTREFRWGPRTLDVDLVWAEGWDGELDPELDLPHPRAHERAFVLLPWLEVDPDAVLPGRGRVDLLAASLDTSGVHRRDDLALS